MNTIAHLVIAAAALSRKSDAMRNRAVTMGAVLPDASMFVFFAWSRWQGWTGTETWDVRYWTEPWQSLGAISNSFALFAALLALALWRKWSFVGVLCAAALLHILCDFALHADDAHRHFWPLSDWRFVSPVSYWDPAHLGWLGAAIETVSLLLASTILWQRFVRPKWRILIASGAVLQSIAFCAQVFWTS